MKHLNKVIAVTLISGGLIGTALVAQSDNKRDAEDAIAINSASIPMDKAIEIALAAVSGKATEAELEVEDGKSIWEIEVLNTNQQMVEIEIDANSGEVLKQELDDDEREGKRHYSKHDKDKRHYNKD